jgi:Fur family transcriptional regulator, ferric uptake regulator
MYCPPPPQKAIGMPKAGDKIARPTRYTEKANRMPKALKSVAVSEPSAAGGMRLTRQRQILLDLIDKTGQHLDAESLYQMAREKDPKLNRVTVYRTLKLLKEGGLVDELDLMHQAGEQHYYETRRKQEHAHVICLSCGKVEEFFGEPLQRLRRQIETDFGFHIVLARTEVGGYCPHCRAIRAAHMEQRAVAPPSRKSAAAVRRKRDKL